ncbi:hypothetical protein PZ938_00475 [Luteipulveratus sp. YIM 133132]|uniref:PH domain-containing protein n=1 Tax=Luteipulveratus flavus TaxID=3031728 RepID=A0ABT6C3X3_9MICO|nr:MULTISPECIES: hypothetical protein [unclassified Luteipulveratus]MDE9364068.1 hypothetical protein [Luteipulveratus sp. YIM 133132]MDF8263572.1 hypothetical protein [Luteipulveratus sp. YIM 133296]
MTIDEQRADRIVRHWTVWYLSAACSLFYVARVAHGSTVEMRRGDLSWGSVALLVVAAAWILLVLMSRARVTADGIGIDLPRRWQHVPWSQVDHLRLPASYNKGIQVVRNDGKVLSTVFPPEYGARLAALGDVELRS